ncbi:hypothetical protein CDAR_589021 [Caerostris darwini]|uniref:Uncharacterized protein n=1 Tax=Caerostris darwini TaxID=1538125 RepID=A0AAV4T7N4_9ARAC|nr:hypothetical protein CDAR_589021 [Caerostris darwini]
MGRSPSVAFENEGFGGVLLLHLRMVVYLSQIFQESEFTGIRQTVRYYVGGGVISVAFEEEKCVDFRDISLESFCCVRGSWEEYITPSDI